MLVTRYYMQPIVCIGFSSMPRILKCMRGWSLRYTRTKDGNTNKKNSFSSPYFGPFLLYLSVLSRKHGISDKNFLMLNGLFSSFCRICNTSSKHYPSKHKQINTFTLPKHLHSFRLLFDITSIDMSYGIFYVIVMRLVSLTSIIKYMPKWKYHLSEPIP